MKDILIELIKLQSSLDEDIPESCTKEWQELINNLLDKLQNDKGSPTKWRKLKSQLIKTHIPDDYMLDEPIKFPFRKDNKQ